MRNAKETRIPLMVLMPLVGLLSGLLSICFLSLFANSSAEWLTGIVFGTLIALCLAMRGILRGYWKPVKLIITSVVAWITSLFVAGFVAGGAHPPELVVPFVGGMVGAFIILGEALYLTCPEFGTWAIVLKAIIWSAVSGALAACGWALGPSFGVNLWHVLHVLHLTGPADLPWGNVAFGDSQPMYSIFVIWQTGVATALAIMLRGCGSHEGLKEIKNP